MNLQQVITEQYLLSHPADAAKLVDAGQVVKAHLSTMPAASLAPLFERLDPSGMRRTFLELDNRQQVELLGQASVRTTLTILQNLEAAERAQLLDQLDEGSRRELEELLAFPDNTAGHYIGRHFANYKTDHRVDEALKLLRDSGQKRARSLYVVDEHNTLCGRVDIQDMALAEPDTPMSALMNPVEGVAYLTSPRTELVEIFDRFQADSIPVVDRDLKLIGIVRYTSLFQMAEDVATADIQKMVGASADEKALSPALFAVRKRLPWLHINLLTAFLAASVVALFENTIAQFTALAILLPVVAGQSGNAGSQALAVTMRGLALKEVSILNWRGVLSKEVRIGIIDGCVLAVTCGLGVFLWSQSLGLAFVIGIAMISSMIAAGIAGALVPMILIRVGQDPATASSIILTTVTDIAGFMSFLGTATLLAFML